MGQESPHKDKPPLEKLPEYPPFKGTRDERSNLVMAHDRNLAQAMTYFQIALSVLILGATIAAFLYLILEGIITDWKRPVICLGVFVSFAFLAGKRTYLSWGHYIKAQFIEEELGGPHTWEKYKLTKKLGQFRAERRYYKILHKILKRIPF